MESRQSESAFVRLAPWAGIAFAILFVVGFFVTGMTPEYDDYPEWQEWLSDSDKQWGSTIGGLLMIVGVLALLWYSQTLAWKLKSETSPLGQIASSAATLMAGMLIAAVIFAIVVHLSILIGDVPVPSSEIAIQFEQAALGFLLVGGCMSGAVYIGAIGTMARGRWPSWLVWASWVGAVLLLAGILFFPLLVLPLWSLVTGIYLLRKPL